VIDRWVQQAVLQVLEPIFEPTFHESSHGFRPNRGAQTAIAEAKRYVEEGHRTVVDLDLSKFFDRVNWQRLLARLAQRVSDKRVLSLIHRMLKAKVVMPDGTRVSVTEGTPQGGPLSPLLSNIVLDELDWELDRRGMRFVRYADDCNIYVGSERAGHRVMDSTRRFIERRLRLRVNEEKSSVTTPDKVHFLGFCLVRGKKGGIEVYLSDRSHQRLMARIRELTPRTWGRSLEACIAQTNGYLRGWHAYFGLCTKEGAYRFRTFDMHIRRRLRVLVIVQKKRRRHLHKHLLARGVTRKAAGATAYLQRGPWFRSHNVGMERAYPNAWFQQRVFTLWDAWRDAHPEPVVASDGQLLLSV
jgi:group II intron reverse transcriptase/maturase